MENNFLYLNLDSSAIQQNSELISVASYSIEISFFYCYLGDASSLYSVCSLCTVHSHMLNLPFVICLIQLTVAGLLGQNGLCVTAVVDEDIRNVQEPAPTQPHSMVEPSVRGRVCRN